MLNKVATITVLPNVFEFRKQRSGELRAGGRAVDLRGQSLKLSTEAAVCERVSLLIGGASMSIGGARPLLGTGPE